MLLQRTFLILILGLSLKCFSQYTQPGFKAPEPASIHSPNATDLGRYGDIPVSLYTGTVDVNVPLYEINEGGIPLKIDLNYDTSGVRVNAVPGWVGQNWSLNAGGVITRIVRGKEADEYDVSRGLSRTSINNALPSNYGVMARVLNWVRGFTCSSGCNELPILNQGYKNASFVLTSADWASNQNLEKIRHDSQYGWLGMVPELTWGEKAYLPDLEPDFFTFNFMGHTGKFFMGQDGQWKVSSESNLKIICDFPDDLIFPISIPEIIEPSHHDFARDYPRIINKISILDDQGNRFDFGLDNSKEITFPDFFDQKRTPVVSSAWYLKSVWDRHRNLLYSFEYEQGPYIAHFYLNWGHVRIINPGTSMPETNDQGQTQWTNSWSNTAIKGAGQLIKPVYLKKIITKSGLSIEFNSSISNAMKFKADDNPIFNPGDFYNNLMLEFQMNWDWDYFVTKLGDFATPNPDFIPYGTQRDVKYLALLKWKQLNNIQVKDKTNNLLTNINLNYTNVPGRRLFLNNLLINGSKSYTFEYYNDDLLPNFMSSAVDHFGYYNGTPFKYTQSTASLPFWRNFHTQRNSSAEHVKYGSLKKIIYPTKGYTQFEFEVNTYSKEVDKNGVLQALPSDGIIGGLRIQKIINNDGKGNNYVQEYQYTIAPSSSRSSGNLLYKPVYLAENISTPYTDQKWTEININPFMPFVNFTGNTIEYETVIVKKGYFNSNSTIQNSQGYVINKFSNYAQYPDYAPINSLVPEYNFNCPRIDRGFERGKLTEKSVFDVNNMLKVKNIYTYQSNQNLRVNAIRRNLISKPPLISEDEESAYQIFYTDKYLIEDRREEFSPGGIITETTKYSYRRLPNETGIMSNGDLFLSTIYKDSGNGGILTTYKYPFDFSDGVSQHMQNNHYFPIVSTTRERTKGDPYDPDSSIPISNERIVFKDIISTLGETTQVPENLKFAKGLHPAETRFTYSKYNYNGNLLEYQMESGRPSSLIWDYDGLRILLKLENISYTSIPQIHINAIRTASSPSGNRAALEQAITNLRNDLSQQGIMITSFMYDNFGNILSVIDPRAYKIQYSYDEFNRVINTKDDAGNILNETNYYFKQ